MGGANPQHSETARGARQTPIEFLRPNPRNPRKRFDDAELDELSASIKERGIIQPVVVRAIPGVADAYEIIAGERRWRAAQRAGLHEIPVIVVEAGDREALEIAIVENVQRADLNALEEAAGYAQLGADYGYSHGDIARVVGKSRSHVANTFRLTNLPEHTRSLAGGRADFGRARARPARRRRPERACRPHRRRGPDGQRHRASWREFRQDRTAAKGDGACRRRHAARLQDKLGLELGTKVTIRHSGESGEIRIAFRDFDQLDDFCRRLLQPRRNEAKRDAVYRDIATQVRSAKWSSLRYAATERRRPSALRTFATVANSGLPSGDSAL